MKLVRLSFCRKPGESSGGGRYSNLDCDEERRERPLPGHSLLDMADEAFEVADDSVPAFEEFAALAHQESSIRIHEKRGGLPGEHLMHFRI